MTLGDETCSSLKRKDENEQFPNSTSKRHCSQIQTESAQESEVNNLIGKEVKLQEGLALAKQYDLVIYKYTFWNFALCKSLQGFAVKVYNNYLNPQRDICFYEVIPPTQTTYCDLDLKFCKAKFVQKELLENPFIMAEVFTDLLA